METPRLDAGFKIADRIYCIASEWTSITLIGMVRLAHFVNRNSAYSRDGRKLILKELLDLRLAQRRCEKFCRDRGGHRLIHA